MSIAFARLTEVAPEEIATHMSDPRMAEHMPLLTGSWNRSRAVAFVETKETCWNRDGLGHWAIIVDGSYAGWGGFQKEGDDWDFGLVLRPEFFGLGLRVAREALAFAREDSRIPYVTFLLPPSRKHLGALSRLGAERIGEVVHANMPFLKFRLGTE